MSEQNSELSQKFSCPVGTELVLQFEENGLQMKSTLVGLDRGGFLIVKTPKTPGVDLLLDRGAVIKGIFHHDGTVFGFVSKVLDSVESPAQLIFLTFPANMEKRELRKNLRIDCFMPATIHKDGKTDYACVITDLSASGCGIILSNTNRQLPMDIELNNVLDLSCEMLGITKDKAVRGTVKNKRMDDKKLHLGFQFNMEDEDIIGQIDSYVNRVLGVIS